MKRDDLSSQVERRKVSRKPYVKPRIEQVQLLPEEAVMISGCKTDSGFGPGQAGCELGGCETQGS